VEGATFKMDITVSLKNQMNKKSLVQILRNHENTGRMWAQYSNFPVSIHLYLHAMASYFRIIFFRSFHILVQFFEGLEHFIILLFSPKEYAINISKRHYSSGAHMHIMKPKQHHHLQFVIAYISVPQHALPYLTLSPFNCPKFCTVIWWIPWSSQNSVVIMLIRKLKTLPLHHCST
jgi:hypothetical protein